MTTGQWNPEQYARFRAQRSEPFYDLTALVQPHTGMRVLDLGCGDGALTAWLHDLRPMLDMAEVRSQVAAQLAKED